jgi:hypothetical protein
MSFCLPDVEKLVAASVAAELRKCGLKVGSDLGNEPSEFNEIRDEVRSLWTENNMLKSQLHALQRFLFQSNTCFIF